MKTETHRHIRVKVQTRARKILIEQTGPDEFRIKVTPPPVKGSANQQVIQLLAKHFDIPPTSIRILKGHTSSSKWIAIPAHSSRCS
jgi:uncharacterized protein (TIGR00251 family)